MVPWTAFVALDHIRVKTQAAGRHRPIKSNQLLCYLSGYMFFPTWICHFIATWPFCTWHVWQLIMTVPSVLYGVPVNIAPHIYYRYSLVNNVPRPQEILYPIATSGCCIPYKIHYCIPHCIPMHIYYAQFTIDVHFFKLMFSVSRCTRICKKKMYIII